jgi:dihydrolipoamide dehydrogenase
MELNFDLIILGGGTGGYVSAIRASPLGLRVAVVEKDKLGGTCLHRGCIPSKSLLRSAEVFSQAKRLIDFGVNAENVSFDFKKVQDRKDMIVEQLYRGVQFLMQKGKVVVFEGQGKISHTTSHEKNSVTVMVYTTDGEVKELTSTHLIIATGSSPKNLPVLQVDGEVIINSDHALELEELPSSIVIIGGGVIGIEWATMLADFGVQVSVVETMSRILPQEDHEISKEAQRLFRKKGIKFHTGARILDHNIEDNSILLTIEVNGNKKELLAEKVLLSVGRKANVENIGLENTKIDVRDGVISTNEFYQTSEPHIYAIGDVIGGLQLAHVASHEGKVAVENIANQDPLPIEYESIPKCIYSHPQIASVGLNEQDAIEEGFTIKIGKFPFKAIGKALVFGDADGFAKVIIDDKSKRILGVHLIGPNVTDLISEAGLAKFLHATQMEFAHSIRPHPSLSEIFSEVTLESENIPIHM